MIVLRQIGPLGRGAAFAGPFACHLFLAPAASHAVEAVVGPDLVFQGREWETRILDPNSDHAQFAIWAHFIAPEDLDVGTLSFTGDDLFELSLGQMCQLVLNEADSFVPAGVNVADIEHVDLNFFIGSQSAYPHDVTINVEDQRCIDSISIAFLDERDGSASKHPIRDETISVINNWGLRLHGIEANISNEGRQLEARYKHLERFDRAVETMSADALCIMALASMEETVKVYGTSYDVDTFEKMKIVIGTFNVFGPVRYSKNFGQASFLLNDGQCVEQIG